MIFEAKMQGWKSKMMLFLCVQTKLRHISIAASCVCLLCTHIRLAKCLIRLRLNPLLLLYNYCCNWWQLLRVYTISILENVGFPFVLFRFIMYIAEFYLQFVLFSSLLSLCVCLNNEKIHKIVQVWVCVSAAAARQRQFRFPVKVCQRSSRIRQIRSEMKIKNIVIDFVWLDPALGCLGVTERWLFQPFAFEGSRFFFRSLECWFYWFALYKMIFSQNVQIHFSRAD